MSSSPISTPSSRSPRRCTSAAPRTALHVSQPALSKRIRKLEERIGGPLLVRRYRDVRLTEAGRLLAERGRQLLRESEATVALSQRAARGEAGRLRIGFGIASILGLLPGRPAAVPPQPSGRPARSCATCPRRIKSKALAAGDDRRRLRAAAGRRPIG